MYTFFSIEWFIGTHIFRLIFKCHNLNLLKYSSQTVLKSIFAIYLTYFILE